MLIAGAGGFAKELIELVSPEDIPYLHFFDDINNNDYLFDKFSILHNLETVKDFFKRRGKKFALGVGNPHAREKLYDLMTACGGMVVTLVSKNAEIGNYQNEIEDGVNIMSGTIITNNIKIGRGSLVNLHCSIGHDTTIGTFCNLSPGVHISGNCFIGDLCDLGTSAVLLPGVSVCSNTIIGAAAVVTKDITEPGTYVGIPAKKIK